MKNREKEIVEFVLRELFATDERLVQQYEVYLSAYDRHQICRDIRRKVEEIFEVGYDEEEIKSETRYEFYNRLKQHIKKYG